jgi:hypothetical protein
MTKDSHQMNTTGARIDEMLSVVLLYTPTASGGFNWQMAFNGGFHSMQSGLNGRRR